MTQATTQSMTIERAIKILGRSPTDMNLRMMITALSLHPWSNSDVENERLTAAKLAKNNIKAFRKAAHAGRPGNNR